MGVTGTIPDQQKSKHEFSVLTYAGRLKSVHQIQVKSGSNVNLKYVLCSKVNQILALHDKLVTPFLIIHITEEKFASEVSIQSCAVLSTMTWYEWKNTFHNLYERTTAHSRTGSVHSYHVDSIGHPGKTRDFCRFFFNSSKGHFPTSKEKCFVNETFHVTSRL